jgi:prepilin-type N-terminal cleavage/methylation domain-containing protein
LDRGFTFIEVLIALALIAICFLPLMQMFLTGLEQTYTSGDLFTARYLSWEGMERLKNLGFTQKQLEEQGDVWEPPAGESPFDLNGKKWRLLRKVIRGTDPLEVRIQVYQEPSGKPLIELVTLIEDLDWALIE